MPYKVIDIYKDLPRTNCGECGKGSCFAFATAAFLEGQPLSDCAPLDPEQRAGMQARLDADQPTGAEHRGPSAEQALRSLLEVMRSTDLATQAAQSGGAYVTEPEEGVRLPFLDAEYLATRRDLLTLRGDPAPTQVKILVFIYLTRAHGDPVSGVWVSYRDLANTVSKSKSYDACTERLAAGLAGIADGDLSRLDELVASLGGTRAASESADVAYLLPALPRVPLLLLFWRADQEFAARASLLVDRDVLGYLDQETTLFLAEAVTARLLGEDLADLAG
jgi:Domain of unknown function (DUF3786)/Putative Fe-S cluster